MSENRDSENICKVSVCIPAFNQPARLMRAIDSVLSQSFQDFEIVVADDSTTDAVANAIKPLADRDGRIRYQLNSPAKGMPANWAESMRLARGAYIKILHHDDWLKGPQSLEKFVAMLDGNSRAKIAFSGSSMCDESGNERWTHTIGADQAERVRKRPELLFCGNAIGAPSAVIVRRGELPAFDDRLKWVVDIDWYIAILRIDHQLAHTPELLVCIEEETPGRVSHDCEKNPRVEIPEFCYLYEKLSAGARPPGKLLRHLVSHVERLGIAGADELRQFGASPALARRIARWLPIYRARRHLHKSLRAIRG